MENAWAGLGRFAALIAYLIYSSFANGFVVMKIYYWFIVGVVPFAPYFNFYQMVGIVLFIRALQTKQLRLLKEDLYKDSEKVLFIKSIINPWIALGVCWIIKLFL